nr:162_t:CDS:1 [Entrophospora candida]
MDYQQWRDEYWEIFDWFRVSNEPRIWILLVLVELKDSSEQTRDILRECLKDLAGETNEILDAMQNNPNEYVESINECLNKCHHCILTPDDVDLRLSLLDKIVTETELPNNFLTSLHEFTDSQQSVLRTMVHQNIQAKVAFIRTISGTHSAPENSEGYHCTNNPYYRQLNLKCSNLLAKHNELLTNNNAKSSNFGYEDGETLPQKVSKMNEKFEREFDQINEQLLENKKTNIQILENMKENKKIDEQLLENKKTNIQILENMKENKKIDEQVLENKKVNTQILTQILENTEKIKSIEDGYDRLFKENKFYKQGLETTKNELTIAEKKVLNLQAALGDATNVRLSDESSNSSLQLGKDITKFKKLVEAFVKVKGKQVQIKEQAANSLLSEFGFKNDKATFKDVLGFILQRIVIDKVFSEIEKITSYKGKNGNFNYLEAAIIDYTNKIIEWTTKLSQTRDGDDHVAKMTPIKIRQQIYETLTLRGFNTSDDAFINSIRNSIINEMNEYREILGEDRNKNVIKHADELVRFGIKLWFRLKIQEPIVDIKWYKPEEAVNTDFMEGPWEIDDINNYGVELCYFPCILSNGKETEIYCKSQVTIRKKSRSWIPGR